MVAQASGGKDVLELNQEKPLDKAAQQALALASQMVNQDSQQELQEYIQQIQQLAQKVQQANQQKAQNAAMNDPTAAAIVKTQMAETERKTKEAQMRMQTETEKAKQDYEIKVAELEQKVVELQAKYTTQTNIDNQRNATDIAMANINNAAKERVAMINANAQIDQQQSQLEYEQNSSAINAIMAADADIRQHGLALEQKVFDAKAAEVQSQIEAELAAQQAMQPEIPEQQPAAPQPTTPPTPTIPPTGAI
jgi:hypothetical protein